MTALATPTLAELVQHPNAEKDCGRLKPFVMDSEDLPEGVSPEDLRKCLCHPLSPVNYWGYGDYLPDWVPSISDVCM